MELVDGQLKPIYVDRKGVRTAGTLRNVRPLMPREGRFFQRLDGQELSAMEVVSAEEYLVGLGFPSADPNGHIVFQLMHGETRLLIPAAVMAAALVGWMSALGDWVVLAATLDRLAVTTFDGEKPTVQLRDCRVINSRQSRQEVQQRFVWMTCFPSARKMFGSIYQNAVKGRLGLSLPLARVNATCAGVGSKRLIFVTRMNISTLTPTESPFSYAQSLAGTTLDFGNYLDDRRKQLSDYRSSIKSRPDILTDKTLQKSAKGWSTTDEEWAEICRRLLGLGCSPLNGARSSVDLALDKLGSGQPWSEYGESAMRTSTLYQRWVRKGKWATVKQVLDLTRAAQPASSATAA